MRKKIRKLCFSLTLVMLMLLPQMVFAAESGSLADANITKPLANLLSIVSTILTAIGEIITLWSIGEWGMAYMSNEGSMQANSFKKITGGMIMVLAPQILPLLLPGA